MKARKKFEQRFEGFYERQKERTIKRDAGKPKVNLYSAEYRKLYGNSSAK
jgi:hypothetical protein